VITKSLDGIVYNFSNSAVLRECRIVLRVYVSRRMK
jgi:hypothetical protein